MNDPQLHYDLTRMRQREMHREAANARLANAARAGGSRPGASLLLPLADAFIALGLRLRRQYQPDASFALVPLAHLPATTTQPATGAASRTSNLLPVFAFQVIQWLPHRTTSLTYWSVLPSAPGPTGTPNTVSGLGLVCLARPVNDRP